MSVQLNARYVLFDILYFKGISFLYIDIKLRVAVYSFIFIHVVYFLKHYTHK